MNIITKSFKKVQFQHEIQSFFICRNLSCMNVCFNKEGSSSLYESTAQEKFRILEIVKKKFERKTYENRLLRNFSQPREEIQPVDQDWGSVWPAARSFHPASVPLPLRMGYPLKKQPPPDKWTNTELVKIPNFLHLTPPVIERQCQALKKFCTKWPDGLETDEDIEKLFPVTIATSTYLHSSPTIRDPLARIATLSFSIGCLKLDDHGFDKMLRLVDKRYDPNTGHITIISDRCPLSTQNVEYCLYILNVLYHEAMKAEPWEDDIARENYQLYVWKGSPSEEVFKKLEQQNGAECPEETKQKYADSCARVLNEGENDEAMAQYGEAVLQLYGIKNVYALQ